MFLHAKIGNSSLFNLLLFYKWVLFKNFKRIIITLFHFKPFLFGGSDCSMKAFLFVCYFDSILFFFLHTNPSFPFLHSSYFPHFPPTRPIFSKVRVRPPLGKSTKSVPSPHWGRTPALPPPPVPRLSKISLHREWAPESQFMH